MNVSLKPELQRFVEEQVKAGHFATPDELIEAGVAQLMLQMDDDEIDDETWAKIEEAEAQFERGEWVSLDEAFPRPRPNHPGAPS